MWWSFALKGPCKLWIWSRCIVHTFSIAKHQSENDAQLDRTGGSSGDHHRRKERHEVLTFSFSAFRFYEQQNVG
jgi:enoyl reductase-like protein